jgi:UTP--glucose-1-phosphate uridylyltransferase
MMSNMSKPPTITKAIIPAAGWGTRMLPAAKAVPKELLPVLDRPTIQYVVEECVAAGVSDVLLITQKDKRAIEDHFDRNAELEQRLAASGKHRLLDSLAHIAASVRFHSVRQSEQRGLGHAVMQAKQHVNGDPCLCLLGDTIFSGGQPPAKQLVEAHARLGGTIIALERVPHERVNRYGIAGGEMIDATTMRITELVEKPSPGAAPSDYAICARYVLAPTVFECLASTSPGQGGEIQLTDALKQLVSREPVHGIVIDAKRHDIGNPVDWLLTNLLFASRDTALWSEIEPTLRSLLARYD